MLNATRDELQIQRCLDHELSPDETRKLLLRLDDVPDGWKILACGFLEERSFAQAIAGETTTSAAGAVTAGALSADSSVGHDPPSAPSNLQPFRGAELSPLRETSPHSGQSRGASRFAQSWSHPLVSLSLCAAIAFVIGLIIRSPGPAEGEPEIAGQKSSLPEAFDGFSGSSPPQALILTVSGNAGSGNTASGNTAGRSPEFAPDQVDQQWLHDLHQNLQNSGYSVRLRQIGPNILIDNAQENRQIMSLLRELTERIGRENSGVRGRDESPAGAQRPE